MGLDFNPKARKQIRVKQGRYVTSCQPVWPCNLEVGLKKKGLSRNMTKTSKM